MRRGAQHLLGEHDFRNFCKIDPALTHYRRRVLSFEVHPVEGLNGGEPHSPNALWEFVVRGQAFMWHQVRCMVAVLFLIGEGREVPEITKGLLDIERFPSRPNYAMASEAPLLLYDIGYDDLTWPHSPTALAGVAAGWEQSQQGHALRGAMYHSMARSLWGVPVLNPFGSPEATWTATASTGGAVVPTGAQARAEAEAAAGAMTQHADQPPATPRPPEESFVTWGALVAQLRPSTPPLKAEGQPLYVPLAKRPAADSAETKAAKRAKKQAASRLEME